MVTITLTYAEACANVAAGSDMLAAIGPLLAGMPPPAARSRIVAARNPREPWHRANPTKQL